MIPLRKFWRFDILLWIATLLVIAFLLGWPPLMNAWAGARWRQVPCHAEKEDVFTYRVDDVPYRCTRRDFWTTLFSEKAKVNARLEDNDTCWVNPANPLDAVLRLDVASHWERAANRLGIAALLLAVTAAFTIIDRKKRAARAKGTAL